jgi:hypothetical protein
VGQSLHQGLVGLEPGIEVKVHLLSISQLREQSSLHFDYFSCDYHFWVRIAELPEHLKRDMQNKINFTGLYFVVSDNQEHQFLVKVIPDEPKPVSFYF